MEEKYIYIKSYGCQMNVYDSNRIKDLFTNKGYKITKDVSKANLTILNTCHIREKAVEKVYSDIGRIDKIKKNSDMKIVVAGCVAQAEGIEIKKRSPAVDFIVGLNPIINYQRWLRNRIKSSIVIFYKTRNLRI